LKEKKRTKKDECSYLNSQTEVERSISQGMPQLSDLKVKPGGRGGGAMS